MKFSLSAHYILAIATTLSAAMPAYAAVNVDPGDYAGLPGGTDLAILYYQHQEADKIYADGKRVASNLGLNLDVGILRFVHYMNLGSWLADPQIMIPFGQQKDDLSGTNLHGVGDILIGSAFWPIHDLVNNEHLGFGTYLYVPTGDNKNDGYGLSNNRYSLNLQVGYIKGLTDKWVVDLTGQTEFFQDQRSTGAKKDQYYQADASLTYNLTPATHISASARSSWGGKETLNGETLLGGEKRNTTILTWASSLTKQFQVQLQYRQDISVKDGPLLKGIQTRFVYAY